MLHKIAANPYLRAVVCIAILIPVYYALYKIYMPKINAFGCFDDCFNYVGGYFITRGKSLYTEIYFNHMPLMAYLSAFIQHYGNPINIYALLLQHRQFLLLFGFIFNVFLCWRFGIIALIYTVLFEFSKFYVFGDRFLAESFIVYPLVYLSGLGIHTFLKKHIGNWERILAGICLWFVVFMREPYILVAVFLFGLIMWPVMQKKVSRIAVAVLAALTGLLFLVFPFRDFVENVIFLNAGRGLSSELAAGNFFGTGILKSFFYPVYLLFAGHWNDFRIQLIAITIMAVASLFLWIRGKKSLRVFVFLFLTLGLANLRAPAPALLYYDAFHEICWYGMFLFSALYLLYERTQALGKRYIFFIVTIPLMAFVLFSPRSFIYQHVDQQTEFITNYGNYLQVSEVIKAVTTPSQTLFTNGSEEFLYVASGRNSSYAYSFYYPTRYKDKYYDAAQSMFVQNPPDIVYDFCTPDSPVKPHLPAEFLTLYTQWYSEGKPTCLYMKTSLALELTEAQKKKAAEFLYYLPEK